MRSARAILCLLFVVGFAVFLTPRHASAQTNTYAPSANTFNAPNVDPDVPRNQHAFAQTTTIEVLSAVYCVLTGIDPIDPSLGCVGINPETRRLGMSKPALDQYGRPEISGLIGESARMISSTYEPIASTGIYTQYLSDSFGIVKKAHAAEAPCDPAKSGYGICGLRPIFKLWETVRNVSYALMTIAFILMGVGVMLRVKIDPRTVMTIQNQIPKVIVSIILITLSYAIAALMIDTMWVTTYAGTYMLTAHDDPQVGNCTDKDPAKRQKLSNKATETMLDTPFTFFNQMFARCSKENNVGPLTQNDRDGGFHVMSRSVSNTVGETIGNVARSLIFDHDDLKSKCGLLHLITCAKKGLVNILTGIVSLVVLIVIFAILVITMFKIWFALLKAYIYALVYIIVGPLYIVFGLLPSKPLGFEKWLRGVFVNVAIFPMTVFMFVVARLLMDLYAVKTTGQFVPPLIGNPTSTNFGALMAFGVLLLIPNIQTILREKMGVKGIGSPGLIAGAIAGGAGVIGGPVSRAYKHLNRHDNSGHAIGAMAVGKDKAGDWALKRVSESKRNPFQQAAKRRLAERESVRSGNSYESVGFRRRQIRDAYKDPKHPYWSTPEGEKLKAKVDSGAIELTRRGKKRNINGHTDAGEGGSGEGGGRMKRFGRALIRRGRSEGKETGAVSIGQIARGAEGSKPTDFKAHSTVRPSQPGSLGTGGTAGTAGTGGSGGAVNTGTLNVNAGTVNMKGGEKSKSFVGEKVDEYIKRLSDTGRKASASANKGKIEVKIQEALKDKDHEELEKMDMHEWEEKINHAFEEAEREGK